MLTYEVEDLPENFRSSIARTMMDQWEMLTSQQAYGPNSYFYVMEPTRLYTPKFVESPQAWPAWYCLDYVFARRKDFTFKHLYLGKKYYRALVYLLSSRRKFKVSNVVLYILPDQGAVNL